jgi:hypothetical protein
MNFTNHLTHDDELAVAINKNNGTPIDEIRNYLQDPLLREQYLQVQKSLAEHKQKNATVLLALLQKAEKKEQYEKLQPTGFEFAPVSAKQYRETLKNENNVQKMQYWHDNVSYNVDHTINIIKLDKTFCEDIS